MKLSGRTENPKVVLFEENVLQEIDSNAAFGSLWSREKCQRLKHNIKDREVVSEEEEENRRKKMRGVFSNSRFHYFRSGHLRT